MSDPFEGLPRRHFRAILADPPWNWDSWSDYDKSGRKSTEFAEYVSQTRSAKNHYNVLSFEELTSLPVADLAATNSVLFMWICWPSLDRALPIISAWGFTYKTCAFSWIKADVSTIDMFSAPKDTDMGLGYWTRSNSEVCLLATRGKPKRLNADVRQGIIAPRREHSRKPDGVHERIERLVAGPYLELFARQQRPGWTVWGNEVERFAPIVREPDLFDPIDDIRKSVAVGFEAIRERKASGGPGWPETGER